jgi:SAM-dependent methyltransferase
MTSAAESRDRIRQYFDRIGDGEWERLGVDARSEVSFEIHRRMLASQLHPGDLALEVGAGGGRFTIELAALGATVVVTDVSQVQLDLNAQHVATAGYEQAVLRRECLDVRDLTSVDDGSFDVVVAFGGPLSYAFEEAEAAFAELLRVTRPGGVVAASVMTTVGTSRFFLSSILNEINELGTERFDEVLKSGDTRHFAGQGHACRMFRWSEITAMIDHHDCVLLAASASNCLSLGDQEAMARVRADPVLWPRFLDWETELAAEPGALDGGTHLVFAVKRGPP